MLRLTTETKTDMILQPNLEEITAKAQAKLLLMAGHRTRDRK